jgi:hypothetical protein
VQRQRRITGTKPVDYHDGNGLNNCWSTLRKCNDALVAFPGVQGLGVQPPAPPDVQAVPVPARQDEREEFPPRRHVDDLDRVGTAAPGEPEHRQAAAPGREAGAGRARVRTRRHPQGRPAGRQLGDVEASGLPAGWEFRLPTEAQWEYACRAGTTTATAFGDRLSSRQANFKGRPYNGAEPGPSLGRAARVGSYPPNAWGLCDMPGNTFEWCRDWYHPRLPGGTDPDLHDRKATSRVRRGGAWTDDGWPCRSAFRLRFEPERRYDHIGFRVAAVRP